jgi:hypothetical protein
MDKEVLDALKAADKKGTWSYGLHKLGEVVSSPKREREGTVRLKNLKRENFKGGNNSAGNNNGGNGTSSNSAGSNNAISAGEPGAESAENGNQNCRGSGSAADGIPADANDNNSSCSPCDVILETTDTVKQTSEGKVNNTNGSQNNSSQKTSEKQKEEQKEEEIEKEEIGMLEKEEEEESEEKMLEKEETRRVQRENVLAKYMKTKRETLNHFRKIMVKAILGTDMIHHGLLRKRMATEDLSENTELLITGEAI